MNYAETLAYLYQQLPMYQRVGKAALPKWSLGNIEQLCQYLGDPHKKLTCVHVGGTNGKGSTTHAIGAILQQTGLRVGMYTSPHYRDFRERIKINGEFISEQAVVEFVAEHRAYFETIQTSFFEITVAMAFHFFAQQKVDIAIIEVGLGGRLDSTNIIQPIISVITNISYDHMNLLGDTLPKIAAEKAGIIKKQTPVVIGEYQEEVAHVFKTTANKLNVPIYFASQHVVCHPFDDSTKKSAIFAQHQTITVYEQGKLSHPKLQTDLLGDYQLKNVATVLQTVAVLQKIGYSITKKQVALALKQVRKLTTFMGRWQFLTDEKPYVLADSAHNLGGLEAVINQLLQWKCDQLHLVVGFVKDKDLHKILKLLPKQATYYFCRPNVPRGLAVDKLYVQAETIGLQGQKYDSVALALAAAQSNARSNDVIYVGGSTFVVAEVC